MGIFNKMSDNLNKESLSGNQKKEKGSERFGFDIKAVIEFKRHQIPGKDPETGMSADYLKPEGQDAAAQDGTKIKEEVVKGYASSKLRAQETVDLMLQNVDDDVRVINKTHDSLTGTVTEESKNQRGDNKFTIRVAKELAVVDNWLKIKPFADDWVKKQIEAGSKLDKLSLTVQWYLDNPGICKEYGVLTAHEEATNIAERAAIELGMIDRLYSKGNVRLVNVSHAPNIIPFLQEVIGFKKIEEIGGALQPGENMELMVNIDHDKNKIVKLLFRDKEYLVEEDRIKALAQEYRDRVNKE